MQRDDVDPDLGFRRRVEIRQVSLEDAVKGLGIERWEPESLE
jgi:hypothetical protein